MRASCRGDSALTSSRSIGLHTCDRRRSKSYLEAAYPDFAFEEFFAEEDPLWTATLEETSAQQAVRMRGQLDELFATNPNTYISITAHSGTITGILASIGHRPYSVQTGGLVPVLVRAYEVASYSTVNPGPSATAPACSTPPNPSNIPTTVAPGASGAPTVSPTAK